MIGPKYGPGGGDHGAPRSRRKCPHAVLVAGKQPNARIDDPPITALSLKHG